MEIVTALLAVLAAIREVEGDVTAFTPIVAALHAGGKLTDDEVATINQNAGIADADYDAQIAAARARIAGGEAPTTT